MSSGAGTTFFIYIPMKHPPRIPLQAKILFGYGVITLVIGYMVFILVQEHRRMESLEREERELHQVRKEISTIHRFITRLAMAGEYVANWCGEDSTVYRRKREKVDSLLLEVREAHLEQVRPAQIDTLRQLLREKENQLMRIAGLYARRKTADSLLLYHLPEVVRQSVRPQTVTRRKKGLAGAFGGKETVTVVPSVPLLQALDRQLAGFREAYGDRLVSHTDSLERQNRRINGELTALIFQLDTLSETGFGSRVERMAGIRAKSLSNISVALLVALAFIIVSHIVIQRDIRRRTRERAELERLLEQNQKLLTMRDRIVMTVSHDIRGPLNTISGHAELARECRSRKKTELHLDKIGDTCRYILHLVNNLLDIYRMGDSRETRHDVPFRLDGLFERLREEYQRKTANKGLLFAMEGCGLAVNVLGDTDRLEQILDNLLDNAVKFTDSGCVRLTATYKTGTLSVMVSDTGTGMDEEMQRLLYVPFERGNQQMNPSGFGLGLAIAKGLVELLEGSLAVESSPGKGSTFTLTVPLPETEEDKETGPVTVTDLRLPRKVLVVDDDTMQLEVIREFLERGGISCTPCKDTNGVVNALRDSRYDLLLTDIQMPRINGFELLELLRSSTIGNSRSVPVLAMTARGDADSRAYLDAGFAGFIHKPFSKDQLLRFLSSFMERKREAIKTSPCFAALLEDVTDKKRVLNSLQEESEREIADLEKGLETADRHLLRETVHRMRPVWELLQTDGILEEYRNVLHDSTAGIDILKSYTEQVIVCIRELINCIEHETEKLEHGKEDTGG